MALFGGIEAGGTKFVCGVGNERGVLLDSVQFLTTNPEETIRMAIDFFNRQPVRIAGIGIGSFGPIDLNPESPTYGYITRTPKPGWQFVDIVGGVQKQLDMPVGFDTDVNAAALGEHYWGAVRDVDTFIYITVGTGIGGGGMVDGNLMHGLVHPEMGHICVPHDNKTDPFEGVCPFHKDCLEGLASGPAIESRWKLKGEELPEEHPAWELESSYLALALMNYICILSPERIVMGGGVMKQVSLLPRIRQHVSEYLNGYIHSAEVDERIDQFIVPASLQDRAGVIGAIALARQRVETDNQ